MPRNDRRAVGPGLWLLAAAVYGVLGALLAKGLVDWASALGKPYEGLAPDPVTHPALLTTVWLVAMALWISSSSRPGRPIAEAPRRPGMVTASAMNAVIGAGLALDAVGVLTSSPASLFPTKLGTLIPPQNYVEQATWPVYVVVTNPAVLMALWIAVAVLVARGALQERREAGQA